MKLFLSFLLCVTGIQLNYAQFFNFPNTQCVNPNQRRGACVSIYDCQTVLSVLQRTPLQPTDRDFVKASECYGGVGQTPHVCCTMDTGFYRQTRNEPQYDDFTNWESPQGNSGAYPFNGDYYDSNEERPRRAQQQPRRRSQQRPSFSSGTPNTRATDAGGRSLPRPPNCGSITISNKILGGVDAELNEFPWMVQLEYNRRSTGRTTADCAGSLINQRYVVTAAHCVKGAIEKVIGPLIGIRLGEHDTSKSLDCNQFACAPESYRVGIEEIIPHERYRDASSNKENDIALIRLDRNVRFSSNIRPICLPSAANSRSVRADTQLTVAGWGRTRNSAKSAIKQKLNVAIVSPDRCRQKFRERKVKIADSQVCAGGVFAEDSCDGDSGGPLMHFNGQAWVLEGLVSFGVKCGLQDWPGVYTRVSSFESWISSHIRD